MSRPFINTLADVRAGGVVDDLDDTLANVVQAVRNTGKTGELTLKLTIKPASKGDIFTLFVDADIKTKLPRLDKGSTVFFADDDNSLTPRDPRQAEIPMRAVDEPKDLGQDQRVAGRPGDGGLPLKRW